VQSPPRSFVLAFGLWTAMALVGQAGRTDDGPVAGPIVLGLVIAAALWLSATRGHRWPWVGLAALLIVGGAFSVSRLDWRLLLGAGDALGLYVLVRAWRLPDSN
jgi:hypothetical protein